MVCWQVRVGFAVLEALSVTRRNIMCVVLTAKYKEIYDSHAHRMTGSTGRGKKPFFPFLYTVSTSAVSYCVVCMCGLCVCILCEIYVRTGFYKGILRVASRRSVTEPTESNKQHGLYRLQRKLTSSAAGGENRLGPVCPRIPRGRPLISAIRGWHGGLTANQNTSCYNKRCWLAGYQGAKGN